MTVVESMSGEVDRFPIGMRVLAVDNDPTCLMQLDGLLRKCQYQVTTVSQARSALMLLRESRNSFDLIIIDMHTSDMDGFKLMEIVGLEMDLPVIMLSASSNPKLVMEGITHGACDYLVKPVRHEDLKNIWQHVIRTKKVDPKSQTKFTSQDKPNQSSEASAVQNVKSPVPWSVDLHRKFVAAVNQLGIDKAVPKSILNLINEEGITRENVASHLQKYRLYLQRVSMLSHSGRQSPYGHSPSLIQPNYTQNLSKIIKTFKPIMSSEDQNTSLFPGISQYPKRCVFMFLALSFLLIVSFSQQVTGNHMYPQKPDYLYCESWKFSAETNNVGTWNRFPKKCELFVQEYMTGDRYKLDLEISADYALSFARTVKIVGDGKDAWVFDIDETLLSNLPYYIEHGFAPDKFDDKMFEEWAKLAVAPALPASLRLYKELQRMGFKIFLLTGRPEEKRSNTKKNLKFAGYTNYEKLILRGPADSGVPGTKYKSKKRRELEEEGYRIHGSSGDQWSDLVGFAVAERSFKLPNPLYYVA